MSPPKVPEEWLRHVWQHQLFDASRLQARNGKPVSIIFPGTPNRDGGPDFTAAKLRVGQTTFHGDIELHVDAAEWQAHRHHLDPHYNAVILHVVLTAGGDIQPATTLTRRALPLLVLHPFLDKRLHHAWEDTFIDIDRRERSPTIPCNSLNEPFPPGTLTHLLKRAAAERLETRVHALGERLKQLIDEQQTTLREPYPRYYGNPDDIPAPQNEYTRKDYASRALWDQVLYEGIVEGMGYAKNRVPFRALSHNLRLEMLRQCTITDSQTMMALLFGAAGLLPPARSIHDRESSAYLRPLRRRWKELRPLLRIPLLHEADWLFFRLRPGNFPTARLATLCFLLPSLFDSDGLRRLIGTFSIEGWAVSKRIAALTRLFDCVPDDFWRNHVTFSEEAGRRGARLGRDRIIELLINTVVPVALLYGRLFRHQALQCHAQNVYDALPASQDNTVTRTIRKQLLRSTIVPQSAWMQQGMIQLYKLYCTQNRCGQCEIGALRFPATPS
jgi:hypothetical protein